MFAVVTGIAARRALSSTPSAAAAASAVSPLAKRAAALFNVVRNANWNDSVLLTQDMPFWEAEFETLKKKGEMRAGHCERLFACMYQVTDAKDHLDELTVTHGKHGGIAGTGLCKSETIDNLAEHASFIDSRYQELKKLYPEFGWKTEDCLGRALASFRQKMRFPFSDSTTFFY